MKQGDTMNRIKELRDSLGLTQKEFAESIGVAYQSISLWENGQQSIGASKILLICKVHNVNQTWLETGEGPMFTVEKSPLDSLNNVNLLVELAKRSIDCLDDQTRATIVSFVTELSKKLSND